MIMRQPLGGDSLVARSQMEEDAEQPDPFLSKAHLLMDPTDYEVITPTLDSRFDQVRRPPVGDKAFSRNSLNIVFFFLL
ncbi:Uncharacterized protein HZ326_24789 [Fusarium oxysporum f. sp. albedinis]|nr:Uncharacterized protein HZ326_24789 [Fusarium oxysporum f. sp. albedinis]